jgi:hypothetical protein
MGGEACIDDGTLVVRGKSNFPSVRVVCAGVAAGSGKWYYETVLLTDGLMQIGWADTMYKGDPARGQGVGDHVHRYFF